MSSTSSRTVKNPNQGGNTTFFIILAVVITVFALFITGIVIKQSNSVPSAWKISASQAPENLNVAVVAEDGGQGRYISFSTNDDVSNIISVFTDAQCPVCHQFASTNGDDLNELVKQGDTAMRVHMMSFLDQSHGSTYSRLVSQTLAILAQNDTPEVTWKFYNSIWDNEPSDTLTAQDMGNIVQNMGAKQENIDKVAQIDPEQEDHENTSNIQALEMTTGEVGTPTVFVNGVSQPNALMPNFFSEILKNGTPEGAEVSDGVHTRGLLKITDPSVTENIQQ